MATLIIDSAFASLEEAVRGTKAPQEIINALRLVDVEYFSFDGKVHAGQLVVHEDIVADVRDLFVLFRGTHFPLHKVVPISLYNWDDEAAMKDNASTAFNYRLILGTDRLSNHSFGRALDINPLLNPYYARDGKVHPENATYDVYIPGTLTKECAAIRLLKGRGWVWGGDWKVPLDYQHLEKPAS